MDGWQQPSVPILSCLGNESQSQGAISSLQQHDRQSYTSPQISQTGEQRIAGWVLLILIVLTIGWVRLLPLKLAPIDDYVRDVSTSDGRQTIAPQLRAGFAERLKSLLQYEGDDHRSHVYLGDSDSYYWLRLARNLERRGTVCDSLVRDRCWDTFGEPPH